MKRFLEKSLKIYQHEIRQFTWLAVIFFAAFFVTAIFRNYVDTAFLEAVRPGLHSLDARYQRHTDDGCPCFCR